MPAQRTYPDTLRRVLVRYEEEWHVAVYDTTGRPDPARGLWHMEGVSRNQGLGKGVVGAGAITEWQELPD